MIRNDENEWGGLEIDERGFVYQNGSRVSLARKEEAVLYLLLLRWPNPVSKSEFEQEIWQQKSMSDESLARCILQARRQIKKNPKVAIKSEYGFGYRAISFVNAKTRPPIRLKETQFQENRKIPARLVETVAHCRSLLNLRHDYGVVDAEILLREVVCKSPDYKEARVVLSKCLTTRITSVIGDQSGLAQEALLTLDSHIRNGCPDEGLLTQWSHALDCDWKFAEARARHLDTIKQFPENSDAHYNYAWHLLLTGDPQSALEILEVAIELNPFSISISLLYARCLQASGNVQEANRSLSELRSRFPDNAVVSLYWVTTQAAQAPSSALYEQARRIHGARVPWPLAGSNLAFIYARCGDENLARDIIKQSENASTELKAIYLPPLFALGEVDEACSRAEALLAKSCSLTPFILRLKINNDMLRQSQRGQKLLSIFECKMKNIIGE